MTKSYSKNAWELSNQIHIYIQDMEEIQSRQKQRNNVEGDQREPESAALII